MLALATQYGIEDFYAEKYLDTLRVGSETESNELFDKSHGFYIAVIQGFFRDYYYTRGSAFSFLAEEKLEYGRYFTPWAQVVPTALPNPAQEPDHGKLLLRRVPVPKSGFADSPGSGAGTKGTGRSGETLERWAVCCPKKGSYCCG
ncbi:MAG: hypothetical protein ACLUS6_00130 [Dysosmobacter sp.]